MTVESEPQEVLDKFQVMKPTLEIKTSAEAAFYFENISFWGHFLEMPNSFMEKSFFTYYAVIVRFEGLITNPFLTKIMCGVKVSVMFLKGLFTIEFNPWVNVIRCFFANTKVQMSSQMIHAWLPLFQCTVHFNIFTNEMC